MSIETKDYDLVVIGGGPAGIIGATTAAASGRKVAVVDSHPELGGAGINTGTVPSKTLRETALALSGMQTRQLYGVDLSLRRAATVADFLRREQVVKAGLNALLAQQMAAYRADVYCGTAEFVDAHTVRVHRCQPSATEPGATTSGDLLLRGQCILIATGSAPLRPPEFPFASAEVYDSDTILQLDRLPATLAVVGAGVIGCEYACTFAALGTQVHLINGRDVLLPFLDRQVARALTAALEQNGIIMHINTRVESCTAEKTGEVTLTFDAGAPLTVGAVLVAVGRKSNTEQLGLAAAGVAVGERGLIDVDERYCTCVPHTYAAGDVIGFPALASTSMQQARRAVQHALNLGAPADTMHLLPTGIYTIPEVGMVGETEESLRNGGVDYIVGRAPYEASARGRIIGDTTGFIKLLFRRADKRLLGVHVMGEQATEIVHIGLVAMLAGATAELFDNACFNIPTLGELYKYATLDALLHNAGAVVESEPIEGL